MQGSPGRDCCFSILVGALRWMLFMFLWHPKLYRLRICLAVTPIGRCLYTRQGNSMICFRFDNLRIWRRSSSMLSSRREKASASGQVEATCPMSLNSIGKMRCCGYNAFDEERIFLMKCNRPSRNQKIATHLKVFFAPQASRNS